MKTKSQANVAYQMLALHITLEEKGEETNRFFLDITSNNMLYS